MAVILLVSGAFARAAQSEPKPARQPIILSVTGDDGKRYVVGKALGNMDAAPVPRVQAVAQYTEADLAGSKEGAVIVSLKVHADGMTSDFSSRGTNKLLMIAAVAAAQKNRYKPAMLRGKSVDCDMELLYTFPGPNSMLMRK